MRIVITGGAGFLGVRLARALLSQSTLTDARGAARSIREIVLLDVVPPPDLGDSRVRGVTGDLADPAVIERAVTADTDTVFHLAAVVSGQAEADFDIGMRVNLDATRLLLERCRRLAAPPKFVFASSLAVFGGPLPDPVPDDAPLTPQASYGTQKAIGELLVYDMTRKGFIDGRSLRLPTVTVRPGKPNKAASSFASGIIREPLSGVDAICPVARATRMWVTSPRTVIANIVKGHEAPANRLRAHALGQRAGDSRSGRSDGRGAAQGRRRRRRRPRQMAIRSGDRQDRRDVGGEFRAEARLRARDDERHGFREHRPRVHRGRHAAPKDLMSLPPGKRAMPATLKHAHIVVAFDLCSSSQIMEDLLLSEKFDRYETFLTCVKRWLMNWTNSHPSGNGRFELYKFTGDGWILLFPAATDGMALHEDPVQPVRNDPRRARPAHHSEPEQRALAFSAPPWESRKAT